MRENTFGTTGDGVLAASSTGSYARLRELFAEAADVDASALPAWLDANISDPEERRALERLLAADRFDSGYLETPADEHAAHMAEDEPLRPEGLIGTSIGPFRLARMLGKGGMAAVFLGAREGADFEQHVAVKLLRRGLYSDIEQRLFRRERQLLATLDHPNIARLIDGGVTAAGIPYLVIEYVDGEPITQHAIHRRLDVRDRLRLFLTVCRAVEAAHRALIVHRDIKPSNILVSAGGVVKLLDFGIAKLVEEDTQAATLGVFTPDYAAPEQLAGLPITTATDVYALGVLLHEMLLGVRPQGNPVRRPSSLVGATTSAQTDATTSIVLARALRGDIDTILLKCLAFDPERRYASAGALADDVDRHLAGKPVEAHPPSRWYRARKFAQRHRGSVGITAVLVVAIFAALALALWQAAAARHQAARAQEVQAFVESLFEPLEEGTAPDKAPTLKDLLQRGLARVETSFHDDLEAQADLLGMFSRIEDQLGEVKANRDLSERAYRVAEKLFGPDDARTLDARAQHARILYRVGDFDAALGELAATRAAMQANGIHGTSMAMVLEDTAFVRNAQGANDDELIALNQQAVNEREHDATSTSENLATGYNNLAIAYYHANQLDRALELFRKAHEKFTLAKGESYVTASSLANIGGVQFRMGRWREGLATQIQAREMFHRIGIDNHQMLAGILMGICETEGSLELNAQSQTSCDDAVDMSAKVLGESHPRFLRALTLRATADIAASRFAQASKDLDRVRAAAPAIKGAGRAAGRAADIVAANLDRMRGDYAQLRIHLAPSMALKSTANDVSAPVLFAWFALACAQAPGDGCGGDVDVDRARTALADPRVAHHPNQLAARNALAQIDLMHGDAGKAAEEIRAGLAIAEPELGDRHTWIGEAHRLLGDAQTALHDSAAADREYALAKTIFDAQPRDNPLRVRSEQAR